MIRSNELYLSRVNQGCSDPSSLHPGLVEVLARISGATPASIQPDASLIDDIGLDSLGFYEILIEADECLGLRIPEQDLLQFRTVADIQHYLDLHLSAEERPPE